MRLGVKHAKAARRSRRRRRASLHVEQRGRRELCFASLFKLAGVALFTEGQRVGRALRRRDRHAAGGRPAVSAADRLAAAYRER